jgi:HSP20 family protein
MAEKRDVKPAEKATAVPVERYSGFMRPFEEMERWFESMFPRGWMSPLRAAEWAPFARPGGLFAHRMPAVDVIDRDDQIVVRAEVPGVRKEDLKVSLTDSDITIEGHTGHEEERQREDYYYREVSSGDFRRTLSLPAEVDSAKAEATMKDGLLEVRLPKAERARRREINIDIK